MKEFIKSKRKHPFLLTFNSMSSLTRNLWEVAAVIAGTRMAPVIFANLNFLLCCKPTILLNMNRNEGRYIFFSSQIFGILCFLFLNNISFSFIRVPKFKGEKQAGDSGRGGKKRGRVVHQPGLARRFPMLKHLVQKFWKLSNLSNYVLLLSL